MPGYTELNAILRSDLAAFTRKVFHTVSPGDVYRDTWHIDAIVWQLLKCQDGEARRLLITQPPRSLKSICTSVALVAWVLGHDPSKQFVVVSYSDKLATDLANQFRLVVESEWYRALFPGVRTTKNSELEFGTSAGGGRIATSIGGTLTGRGADIIIIDDPLKAEDAMSKPARDKVIGWYGSTLVTRLNDKQTGVIIVVMQRLHEEDLAGFLLEQGGWQHLDLPATAVEDQEIPIGPGEVHKRKAGDVLHPEREPREVLDRIKADIGSLRFSAQYQQRPAPVEGNMIKRIWFQTYEDRPERRSGDQVVQSWDVATTTNEANDYSVCTTWLVRKKVYYLLHVLRDRFEHPALKRKIVSMARDHGANRVLIEKAGIGLPLIQALRQDSARDVPNPIGIKPDGDKLMRMEAQTAKIEAGQVFLPKDAPWLGDFLDELLAFPKGRHDDQVDSVSQFLKWASERQHSTFAGGGAILIELEEPGAPY